MKGVIHKVIAEDMEAWRKALEIMAGSKLMSQIRLADRDRAAGRKGSFVAWENLKGA